MSGENTGTFKPSLLPLTERNMNKVEQFYDLLEDDLLSRDYEVDIIKDKQTTITKEGMEKPFVLHHYIVEEFLSFDVVTPQMGYESLVTDFLDRL